MAGLPSLVLTAQFFIYNTARGIFSAALFLFISLFFAKGEKEQTATRPNVSQF